MFGRGLFAMKRGWCFCLWNYVKAFCVGMPVLFGQFQTMLDPQHKNAASGLTAPSAHGFDACLILSRLIVAYLVSFYLVSPYLVLIGSYAVLFRVRCCRALSAARAASPRAASPRALWRWRDSSGSSGRFPSSSWATILGIFIKTLNINDKTMDYHASMDSLIESNQ